MLSNNKHILAFQLSSPLKEADLSTIFAGKSTTFATNYATFSQSIDDVGYDVNSD